MVRNSTASQPERTDVKGYFMTDRKSILVTGGAGYIGSHCCKMLREAGYNPVTFDNLSTGHAQFAKWGPLVVGDIRNTADVATVVADHNVEAVMHFAAASVVSESMVDPEKYYSNNVAGTLSVLTAMKKTGCDKIVLSSTGAVYGEAAVGIVSESSRCDPLNPYGRSKLTAERMAADFCAASDLRATALRYFNACGAEESGSIGELRTPETHLIPRALMKLQGHVEDFAIFGNDYNTPDGTAIRDYIHVVDLIEAHLLALNALFEGSSGGTFNLGTGVGYSVKQILQVIEDVTRQSVEPVSRPRRSGDPAVLVADPAQASSALGFLPKRSQLYSIVSSAWRWHRTAHPAQQNSLSV